MNFHAWHEAHYSSEYCPYYKKDIELIEEVYHRATKVIEG